MSQFEGLLWLLLMLGPLILLQRSLHRELQAIFLLVFRRMDVVLVLFSVLLFPGVLLHETSHFLAARLLGVSTGKFSLIPQRLNDGRVRMGYVETGNTDVLRDALIGAAPLITGGIFVAYVGIFRWGLSDVWVSFSNGGLDGGLAALVQVYALPDFWLWFYLMLAVSSTMMPSEADRRAWVPVLLVIAFLTAAAIFLGAGEWMLVNLAPYLNDGLRAVAVVFAISSLAHVLVWLPLIFFRRLLSKIMRVQVVG